MNYQSCFEKLTGAVGGDLNNAILSLLPSGCTHEISPLGNLTVTFKGDSDAVLLLDAHKDTIHFVVTSITPDGFIKVAPCGGIDSRVIVGSEVTVWGREPILGVFTIMPPHLKKSPDSSVRSVEEQAIDVGYSYGEVQKKVSIGDKVTFRSPLTILKGNCVSTSGLDNLAGVAVMLALAEKLVSYKHLSKTVVLQFSNFEETGHRYAGAVTGAFAAKPTQAIVIDASFAKTPSLNYPTPGTLGGGVMIGFSPMLSAKMSRSLRDLATQHQIPYTEEVMGGTSGTNADGIQSSCFGVPTALLSYPLKNMHTPVEVIDKTDLDHMVHLLDLYISKGGVISELC